jgi:hypothetical protein
VTDATAGPLLLCFDILCPAFVLFFLLATPSLGNRKVLPINRFRVEGFRGFRGEAKCT